MPNWYASTPVMPFGKYRGRPLDELPDDYLRWLVTRALDDPLAAELRDEVRRRRHEEQSTHREWKHSQQRPPRDRRPSAPPVDDLDALITSGQRALAKRFHPDLEGGDLPRMQAINHAADWLRARIRELLP